MDSEPALVSVSFTGFSEGDSSILALFMEELKEEIAAVSNERSLKLSSVVEQALLFRRTSRKSFASFPASPLSTGNSAFSLYPSGSRKRFYAGAVLSKTMGRPIDFIYRDKVRKALVKEIFPWGFRGLTVNGCRNFRWSRAALYRGGAKVSSTLLKVQLYSYSGLSRVSVWVHEDYENRDGLEASSWQETVTFPSGHYAQNPAGGIGM